MVRLAIALMMFVSGMAPAISCEFSSEPPIQIGSLDSCRSLAPPANSAVANQSSPSSDREVSRSLPCAFCSPICHHAVTLTSPTETLLLLEVPSFLDFPIDAYSSIDLDLPKEPPRSS